LNKKGLEIKLLGQLLIFVVVVVVVILIILAMAGKGGGILENLKYLR